MTLFGKAKDNNIQVNPKQRRVFKLPIALHIYSAFTLIILFFFISISIGFNRIYSGYIQSECSARIDRSVNSCKSFATQINEIPQDERLTDPIQIRNEKFNRLVTSTDVSIDASLALFYRDNTNENKEKYSLLWPSNYYSVSATNNTIAILNKILDSDGIHVKKANSITIDNKVYYYRFVDLEYDNPEDSSDTPNKYYMLFFVDSSNYVSFADRLNEALFNTMIISIISAGLLSIIVSFPIISSTRKLSRFANRIGKNNFEPFKGHITSRELYDLGERMNQTACKLATNDREQKTFFQNASHELRTPLMSIQGYAEGIKYKVFDDKKQEEAIDIIISETTRLSDMVENLLSISKMDLSASKNLEIKKTIVNVYELLGITIDKVRGGFLHNNKELKYDITIKDNVYIYANENDIFRMLENVFSNALRYSSKSVTFFCYTKEDKVVFEISDDGPGINEELKDKIFDRFAKSNDGKHGIGLALVKSIATEHDGVVVARNKEEGGAIFTITLPTIHASTQITLVNKNN